MKGGRGSYKKKTEKYKVNELIEAEKVRLVGEEGDPVIIATADALKIAEKKKLDLVEISPNQDPPVAKIIDYAKFKFEQIKQAKAAKKKQKIIHIKEVKMRPAIDTHDFNHKVKHAREFLSKGDKVKFTLMFRGREMAHPELGFKVMERIKESINDIAIIEKNPVREGRNITMFVSLRPGMKKS